MKKNFLFGLLLTFFGLSLISCDDDSVSEGPQRLILDSEIAYYPLDGNANEGTGKTLHGTINGAVLTTDKDDNLNSAYLFDGTDDYITFGDSSYYEFDTLFSVSIWAMPTGTTNGILFNKEGEYELAKFSNGELNWAIANTNPGWKWQATNHTMTLNEWVHIVITYQSGVVKTYINGALNHTYNGSGAVGDFHSANSLRIGGREVGSQFFQGKLDHFQLFNDALTAAQVLELYNDRL